jgi:hypothetical protein
MATGIIREVFKSLRPGVDCRALKCYSIVKLIYH